MTTLPPNELQPVLGRPLAVPAPARNSGRLGWLVAGLALAPLCRAFAPALHDLAFNWLNLAEYSYGPVVPVIAAAMIVRDLRVSEVPRRRDWLGPVLVAVGCLPALLAASSPFVYPAELGLWLAAVGLFVGIEGRARAWTAWPGFVYLLFALPLPGLLFGRLNIELQAISSALGVAMIRAFDVPVFREGNIIDLGGLKLQVAEACSGLRYLFPLASFAFLAAYLFRGRPWHRLLLVLSALPITIGMNSFRIGATGLLSERLGIEAAQGFLHDFEGWLVFCGCIGILMLEMKAFCLLEPRNNALLQRLDLSWPRRKPQAPLPSTPSFHPSLASFAIALAAALAAAAIGSLESAPPEREALAIFPQQLGTLSAMPGETDATEIAALALTDYVSLDYVQPAEAGLDTAPVNLWIAYYASQKFGRSVHSPQFCIPGSGWTIDRLDVISADVPASGGTRRLPVNRAVISKGAARQLVFYWFKERGRSEANEYAVKFHILVDAIESGRTDGALVRLVTPLLPGAGGEAAADRRLRNMTALIAPLLPRYIPD